VAIAVATLLPINSGAKENEYDVHGVVSDRIISEQRSRLASNTQGKGFGPQSPRDIDATAGHNPILFSAAPPSSKMNLCNIHFHKNAEHKGAEFSRFAGNGDGYGFQSGYQYTGRLSPAKLESAGHDICPSEHGSLNSGDTIEVHYVYSSAAVRPGPTLGSCMNNAIINPQLRVEAQVYVLVKDKSALDFSALTKYEEMNGLYQALNIPSNTGAPVQYAGSTTGPGYNEQGSPFLVSWSVRPDVAEVDVKTVGTWCKGNIFDEDHAHGVRNLIVNPDLLSEIGR